MYLYQSRINQNDVRLGVKLILMLHIDYLSQECLFVGLPKLYEILLQKYDKGITNVAGEKTFVFDFSEGLIRLDC